MSHLDVSVNQYLARMAQSIHGGEKLGRDFWVAVRELENYEPRSTCSWSYKPSSHKAKQNASRLERLWSQGLNDALHSPDSQGILRFITYQFKEQSSRLGPLAFNKTVPALSEKNDNTLRSALESLTHEVIF